MVEFSVHGAQTEFSMGGCQISAFPPCHKLQELQNELERLHVRLARVETHLKLDIPRDDAVEVITNLQELTRVSGHTRPAGR